MKQIITALVLSLILFVVSEESTAQITNYQISSLSYMLQNEEQVYYCPTDGSVLCATWRDFRLGYRRCGIGLSTDGGATWTDWLNDLLIHFDNRQSDPTMTVGSDGTFYLSFLDYSPTVPGYDSSFIVFVNSSDKGQTWNGPYKVSGPGEYFEDKQFIACDRTGGTYEGNVYVAWARFPNPTRMMFARSLDGAETFEDTIIVGPSQSGCSSDAGQFAQPLVGTDGAVYVFWSGNYLPDPEVCEGYYAMKMSKSTDGGVTWPIMAQPIFQYNSVSYADGSIDIYNCPAGDIDITGGPYDGNIYISATNGNADDTYYHSDIVMIRSTDNGVTWDDPLRVNDDPLGVNVDQFHPWLTVNQEGVIGMIFYDQRMDPNHYLFDVFGAYSFDGGATFTTNHRITTVSSSPDNLKRSIDEPRRDPLEGQIDENGVYHVMSPMAGKIAEYIGVTAFHDSITAVWTDTRNTQQDVYGATFIIPFMEPRLFGTPDDSFIAIGDSLCWSTCWHENDVEYRVEIDDDPDFLSIDQSEIVTDNQLPYSSLSLADDQYYWRVKAFRLSEDDSTEYSETRSFNIDTQAPSIATVISPDDEYLYGDIEEFTWTADPADPNGAPEYYRLKLYIQDLVSPVEYYYEGIADTFFAFPAEVIPDTTFIWSVEHYDMAGNSDGYSASGTFRLALYFCGDANGDGTVNITDASYIINAIFFGGTLPDPEESADANMDGSMNIADASYLVYYIFFGGPAPCETTR